MYSFIYTNLLMGQFVRSMKERIVRLLMIAQDEMIGAFEKVQKMYSQQIN